MENDEVMGLLQRIERGDEGAFRELYRAFSRRLYAYVLRQHGDPAQAEEIVSDTLYEIWKAPGKFRGDAQFSTWLIGIARNKVLMAFRSRKPWSPSAPRLLSRSPGNCSASYSISTVGAP